jgi:hypothetical protein
VNELDASLRSKTMEYAHPCANSSQIRAILLTACRFLAWECATLDDLSATARHPVGQAR